MFYKKYEDYLKEYINKDISIKSVKPHEEKVFNEFQAKAILDSNPETFREEFHFVLDLISSRKEVNEEKTNDLKQSFERMLKNIDPSDYNTLRFSIYKSRMIVLKQDIREQETRTKDAAPTFTSNTQLQASDELVSPKLVAEQERRFAEQASLNKRDNVKQEVLSNEQIKENVSMHVNSVHTTNQYTKEEHHERLKVSDLKEQFEKERSFNKEPHSAGVPSGTVNRLRQYYEGLNHSSNDHSPLESRKSSRWRTPQKNDSLNVQNRQNQPTDRRSQRDEGTSSYQKAPSLKGTSEFVRRGNESTVYTNESSPTNKAEPDQTGMTNEEFQRRRDRFGNLPGPSNEPPVIERTTQSEPDNYQTATYQNSPRQQRSSELVQEGRASRVDSNDTLRTNNAESGSAGRSNEEIQRYRDRFGNLPGPSNEPPVIERTTQSESDNYQTATYQNPPRQQRSSELVQEGRASRVDSNDTLRTNNAESGSAGRSNEEIQRYRDRFGNLPGPSNEPPVIERTNQRKPANYQTATYQNPPRQQRSSELVQEAQASRVDNNDSLRTNNAEWNQTGRANEEFQRYRDRFGNLPGPSNEPPVIERTTQSEPDNYQTATYQNPPRQQRSSELVQESQASRIDNNDSLRTNNAELSQTGRADEEFQNLRARFENLTGTSSEPSLSKKKSRGESEHQGTSYHRAITRHDSSESVRKVNESAVDTNDSSSANKIKSNQTGLTNEEFQNRRARFENPSVKSDNRLATEATGQVRAARDQFEKASNLPDDRPAPESTGRVRATRDQFEKANAHPNERPVPESTGRVRATRDQFEKANAHPNERPVPESTGRVRAARDQFEKASDLPDDRPAPESTGRVRAARDQFEKANAHPNERPVPESTGRVRAARDQFEKASNLPNDRPVSESTGRVEEMRRQYESRNGRETEASVSNETFQQQNGLANERFRQRRDQFENPVVTSSDGSKSEETAIADQLDRRKETSNQPTANSADQTGIAAGNTKKIRELLADKLKFNPVEKVPPETNTQTATQIDSSHPPVEESASDTQNSQMRNQMREGGELRSTKLDGTSTATGGMDKKQSQSTVDSLDKLGIDVSSDTFGLNENASDKTDKSTETDSMNDDVELPGSVPLTEKKKIHTKKSRAIQIGRLLLNLLPLASWPLISMWVTGILGIVPIYFAMYGLPLTRFIYVTILIAVYGPKLINYILKLRSRIQTYRQAERSRQRNLEDRVIDPKEKSIQRETAAHEKETAKTKQQNHSSEKVSPENSEKDKSVKGYFKRNWKSLAIIFGVGIVVAGIGIALTPVIAPYIFAIATSTPLFMYKVTSVIAMALAVSFGVTALSKGLHALQRKFYKKEDQTLETTTQKETIEKNSLEVDKNFDKAYEKVDKDDRAPAHDNSSIKSAGSKEDGIKLASNETKSMEKSPYAWVYGQETENKTQNEANRSSRSNSFNTHETLHVKADIHEPPSQSSRDNRTTNQLGEAARHRLDNTKSESNPQITEQNKGINRQPAVKEAFDSIKQKAISKSNNVSGKPLLKGQISFEK
ncbi:hypothetical protein GUI51_00100 [Enterococcus mundtii]|uniref:hypothetical protein n=1 Tax=Enterococcus mundtii TaxID=53346 RepID=UPI00136B1FA5|nr:hypothetical protein [Enterococcus mundtii]MZZ60306.1 hypothetical protein [Enterococcus mundtii]MZZ67291.1 hypothetical protein [Enterococcus mundtii]MZZ96142.1 hypothetical protein [Enterococcus mundtii]NAE12737.1 hypothetical protein [Enterococcus mundtii]